MKLYVAGVRHHDPMGRSRLVSWLKSVQETENVDPEFIGIEYDQDFAKSMIRQREKFIKDAVTFFPNEMPETYIQLKMAFCFEADTHLELLNDVEVLWLDPNTQANAMSIMNIGFYRETVLEQYQASRRSVPAEKSTGNLLGDISKGAWSGTDDLNQSTLERDKRFATAILPRVKNHADGWAAIILGSDHVQHRENSTVDILQKAGVECIVTILDGIYPIQETA